MVKGTLPFAGRAGRAFVAPEALDAQNSKPTFASTVRGGDPDFSGIAKNAFYIEDGERDTP